MEVQYLRYDINTISWLNKLILDLQFLFLNIMKIVWDQRSFTGYENQKSCLLQLLPELLLKFLDIQ